MLQTSIPTPTHNAVPTPSPKTVQDWAQMVDRVLAHAFINDPNRLQYVRGQILTVCSIAFIDGLQAELQKEIAKVNAVSLAGRKAKRTRRGKK